MHEKTNHWDQNDSLVMQRREFAKTALHFQVCPMVCLIGRCSLSSSSEIRSLIFCCRKKSKISWQPGEWFVWAFFYYYHLFFFLAVKIYVKL